MPFEILHTGFAYIVFVSGIQLLPCSIRDHSDYLYSQWRGIEHLHKSFNA